MVTETGREYKTLVTATGKAKIAAAIQGSGGVINITQAAVGNGGGVYYVPTADMTALRGEVWRGDIAGEWINKDSPNMVDVKMILPADVGGFTVREAALFDVDGDMIAVCNVPDTEKAVITTGTAGTLTIVMHIVLIDVDAVEFTINPLLDIVTADDVERMIELALEKHNTDLRAHEIRRRVIAMRTRDPGKPDYGVGGSGDWTVALDASSPYTGNTELGVVVSGTEYDANNLSSNKETAPSGTIIIKKMEE